MRSTPINSNVLLDGMSFKNPVNHGGMFGQNFGSFGNPFPQIAIQEYQASQTQNFGAEIRPVRIGVLQRVTKTGGDQFHGEHSSSGSRRRSSARPFSQRDPKQPDFDRKQFGGDFGGPIIPGKLTFYVAVEGAAQIMPARAFNVTASVPQNIEDQSQRSGPGGSSTRDCISASSPISWTPRIRSTSLATLVVRVI